ncbi:C-reactive protein-like isoform X2 [Acropora muricata]|uniref:C-reactive protein-like isoform X2 n=1 Tax=Acropora muricata TaxID=159855 RepID=UPI0034E55045
MKHSDHGRESVVLLKMRGSGFSSSCLWLAISVFITSFFIIVDSNINRGPTTASARFQAFKDYVLENNVIASYQVTSQVECGSKCLRDTRCLSFNYKITNSNMDECEINKVNKSTCPGCYHAQKNSTYYDDEMNRCIGSDDEWSNYDLYFPIKAVNSYVKQTLSSDLDMFTICFWMETSDSQPGTTFSYAISSSINELTLFRNQLAINGAYSNYDLGKYYNGQKHHVCVKWENKTGSWNLTVDGKFTNHGSGFQVGHVIRRGGIVIVGQDQDSYGSAFELSQSFTGKISGINLWSRVLSHNEILRMSMIDYTENGDVLKWPDFVVSRYKVEMQCPSQLIWN